MYSFEDLYLTEREYEILQDINLDTPLLANKLGISKRTLQWHMTKIYAKFRVKNKYQLLIKLVESLPNHLAR